MSSQIFNKPFHIGTARFNSSTYKENLIWKKRKNWKGCCYGFDKQISTNIMQGDYIFVIEMNNSINQIMGIGLIKKIFIPEHRSRIYKIQCWNSFLYKSKYHITRDDILAQKPKNKLVLLILERILFYGYKHFKRSQGCTILSQDRIATFGNKINSKKNKKNKKVYRCSKCGLPRKGHKCEGVRIAMKKFNKKCRICGKRKKGHICEGLKKNFKLLNIILKFFKELF